MLSRPERMLCGEVELARMAEEPGKLGCQQAEEFLCGRRLTLLGSIEQRTQSGAVEAPKPPTPAVQEFAVPFHQLDACQVQGQTPRPFKLLVR